MHAVVLALGASDVGQPLRGQAGPLQGVRHHQVVQERCVLLPDLVLLVDHALLHRLVESIRFFVGHSAVTYSTNLKQVDLKVHCLSSMI